MSSKTDTPLNGQPPTALNSGQGHLTSPLSASNELNQLALHFPITRVDICGLSDTLFQNTADRTIFRAQKGLWNCEIAYTPSDIYGELCRLKDDADERNEFIDRDEYASALVKFADYSTPPNTKNPTSRARELVRLLERETPRRQIKILGADAVKSQPAPTAILEGILFENSAAEICGGQATFKSFQALSIAEAIAGGHCWNGRETKRVPVVYITGEGRAGLKQRITALEIQHQRPCETQFILEAVQLHRPDEIEALLWAISELPEKPGLIVVDTLARCFVGGDENSARDAGLFVAGIDHIRAETGSSVLVLHHLSKNGDSRGSTAFSGAFDTIIEARRENTTVTLRCLKQKDAAEFEPFTLVRRIVELPENNEYGQPLTSLVFEETNAPETQAQPLSKAEATQCRILQVLEHDFCDGVRKADLWEKIQPMKIVSRSGFYDHLKALENSRKIVVDSWGVVIPSNSSSPSNLDNLESGILSSPSNNSLELDGLDNQTDKNRRNDISSLYGSD